MTVVIAMWSGPRNISTTMMRAFGNRKNAVAIDEPFYGAYLAASGADHPLRKETLAAYPSTHFGVLAWIGERSATTPELFLKHIAYHLPDGADFNFLAGWRNFLLIRDPRAMVASFSNKFDDVTPIARSFAVERAIHDYLSARGLPCPVVDAADVQKAPERMLQRLCEALAIAYDPAMLGWEAGPRPEDGPWAPHWYDAVRASTGFRPLVEKPVSLSAELEKVAAASAADYRHLSQRKILP
jgi:hypothetical protein